MSNKNLNLKKSERTQPDCFFLPQGSKDFSKTISNEIIFK